MKPIVHFTGLGTTEYKDAWQYQEKLFMEIVEHKMQMRSNPETITWSKKNHLLFCEHPHVYTLGKSGSENNLLINTLQLQQKNASFIKTNRGGDITYHGPGQVVGYPIFDLDQFGITLREYIEKLEESVIITLNHYNINAERLKGATGVWLDVNKPCTRKICAIGVRSSHWVTMHGFAFNINTNLSYFNYINPCGFTDKTVTSLQKETGRNHDINEIKSLLKMNLAEVFGYTYD